MPTSMTASHGGVLYYVVKVPKDEPTAADYVSATASHKYLEEKRTLSPLNLEWENPFCTTPGILCAGGDDGRASGPLQGVKSRATPAAAAVAITLKYHL